MADVLRKPEPQTPVQTEEAGFLSALEDVVSIAERLAPHCPTTDSLIEVCRLALESPSQLQLLLSLSKQALPRR